MVAARALPDLPELTVEQAEGWVAAALAEARALRQYDDPLFPANDDPDAMRVAEQLHGAWRRWGDEAAALYERVQPLLTSRLHVAGAHDLDYAIGRTYAMLKLSPRDMLARQEQVRRGQVMSAEEVRRELRVAPRG
jgi:hypothetical protein